MPGSRSRHSPDRGSGEAAPASAGSVPLLQIRTLELRDRIIVAVPFGRHEAHPGSRNAGARIACGLRNGRSPAPTSHARLVLVRAPAALAGPEHGDTHGAGRLDHEVREVIIEHAGRQQTGLPPVATRRSGDTEIVISMLIRWSWGCEGSLGAEKQPIRVSPGAMVRLHRPGRTRIRCQCAGRVAGVRREISRLRPVTAGADATAPPRLEGGAERSVRPPVGECRENCIHRRGGPLEGVGTTPDRRILTRNRLGTCSQVMLPRKAIRPRPRLGRVPAREHSD